MLDTIINAKWIKSMASNNQDLIDKPGCATVASAIYSFKGEYSLSDCQQNKFIGKALK